MKRALVVAIVLAAVCGGAASSAPTGTVLALVWERNTLSLASLDGRALAPRGRLLALGRASGEVSTDRIGDRLAVASAGVGIVVVDTRRSKVLWRLPRGRLVRAVSWLTPTRLLVAEHGGVLLLDTARERIVARSDYDGVVLASAEWKTGLVLLTFPNEGSIGAARLFVFGPGVSVRGIEVSRIAAGWASAPTSEYDFNTARPGLAVDPNAGRAYVAGGQHIATVDLRSLTMSYSGPERTEQKWSTGPRRIAAWLGNGVLAVSGADEKWTESGGVSTPFGLRYVGPAGVRLVDEHATDVRVAGDLALAFGSRYAAGRPVGMGLAAYDRAGNLRWRLFGDTPITDVRVANGLAYVWVARRLHVVDPATGAVVGGADVPRTRWLQILG
jgi:hypothetical protein